MPLITKASRRVKKPAWQRGKRPPLKAQRDAQAIVANHERKFSRSFSKLLRDLLTPDMMKTISRAIRENDTVESMLNAMPFFDPDDPETFAIWEGFALKAEKAYASVIDESVKNEFRVRGWPIKVLKVELPEIPVNPSVVDFIRNAALTRVVDISNKERERIREILVAGLESGAHVTAMVDEIQDTVGLTAFQTRRLKRKVDAAIDAGMSRAGARKLTEDGARKIRGQRARAIARTETNTAMSVGLRESWRVATDEGLMPPTTKKKWAAMPFEEGRSSEICQDLDGQEVDVNASFSSSVDPGFVGAGPPAHINCRSTLILVFPE